jgi:hypothetical protein
LPHFKVTFSKGICATNLESLSSLKVEIADVLEAIGWLNDPCKLDDLVRCISLCSDAERRVLACTFAHLRAMIFMTSNSSADGGEIPAVDMILEDNVRLDTVRTYAKFHELKQAIQNSKVKIDLWYAGYLGREIDLALVHSECSSLKSCDVASPSSCSSNPSASSASSSSTLSSSIVAPFPSGNIPLWGCYAYAISSAALTCLLSELKQGKPSKTLFEAKRNKKKGMVSFPIDRMLPRRLRSHNFQIYRAVKPLVFRMPPPHPKLITPSCQVVHTSSSSPKCGESCQSGLVGGLSSTIHPHLDIRFYTATTYQLKLTGHTTSSNCWDNIWLLEAERQSVYLFQKDEEIAKFRVPYSDHISASGCS